MSANNENCLCFSSDGFGSGCAIVPKYYCKRSRWHIFYIEGGNLFGVCVVRLATNIGHKR